MTSSAAFLLRHFSSKPNALSGLSSGVLYHLNHSRIPVCFASWGRRKSGNFRISFLSFHVSVLPITRTHEELKLQNECNICSSYQIRFRGIWSQRRRCRSTGRREDPQSWWRSSSSQARHHRSLLVLLRFWPSNIWNNSQIVIYLVRGFNVLYVLLCFKWGEKNIHPLNLGDRSGGEGLWSDLHYVYWIIITLALHDRVLNVGVLPCLW
jgi:hypothetical protein